MRWQTLLAVLLGLSIMWFNPRPPSASFAEGPPDARRPPLRVEPPERPPGGVSLPANTPHYDHSLFDSGGYVRFQLIQGRLQLDSPRHRQGTEQRNEPDIYESITVTASRGLPSLHYVCHTASQHLTLSVQDAGNVTLESWFPRSGERAKLIQPPFGPVTFDVTRGELHESYQANTLLHLKIKSPISFNEHCGGIIGRALRGRCLHQLAEQTQSELLEMICRSPIPTLNEVRHEMERLKSPKIADRSQAERQLMSWGSVVLPMVQRIGTNDLDAEQRHRLARIKRRLRPAVDDTPTTLALLLLNDAEYWEGIAAELTEHQWVSANQHLTSVGLTPLPELVSVARIANLP